MKNPKQIIRAMLSTDGVLLALVPADRILMAWPDSFATLPAISYSIIDNFNTDTDRYDNMPISDNVTAQVDIFQKPGASTTAIFEAINDIFEAHGWNRSSFVELVEPGTNMMHVVCRYETVLYR